MYRELVAPSAQEFLETFGVEPVSSGSESTVRTIDFDVDDQNLVSFSYDAVGRSVRIVWKVDGRVALDLFREGAVLIRLCRDGDRASVEVDSETDSLAGKIEITLAPEVQIKDKLLLV
jgi:hypothetical protein